jgi:cell division protein ZipA
VEDELFESTASESSERAALVPTVPSEDVSHLLGKIDPRQEDADNGEYLPCSVTEWVVDISWKGDIARNAEEIAEHFRGEKLRRLGAGTLFGRDASTGKWTFLASANGPTEVTALKAAWSYFAPWQRPPIIADTALFEERAETMRKNLEGFEELAVRASVDPIEAAKRVHRFVRLQEKFDGEIAIRLKAPFLRKFEGEKIWDVMLCLGLRWGDMDLFHWRNESGYGDDSYFSVSTSTAPGYFLPEEVAAGRVKVEDLVFGFSLVRSADPVAVCRGMLAAVDYAKSRLGGKIEDLDGDPVDAEEMLEAIRAEVAELEEEGFVPGSGPALRFF